MFTVALCAELLSRVVSTLGTLRHHVTAKIIHNRQTYPTDFTDADSDFADATRGYPTDFADETNS